nr:unnamed protein product [Callosobruchus analis]
MADWVHCNKCSIIFKPNVKFFLTECSHIFCQSCIASINETKCVVCQKSNCYIEICKSMDPNIQLFFNPAEYQIKKTMEILQFQTQQRIRQYQTVAKKYAFAKRECMKLYSRNKALMQHVKMLQNMIEQTKAAVMNGVMPKFLFRPNQFAASSTPSSMTPAMTSDRSGMDDVSQISSVPPCTPSTNFGARSPAAPTWKRSVLHGNGQNYPQVSHISL